jgi:hypothetical protein
LLINVLEMSSPDTIINSLDEAEWELIVLALREMDCGIKAKCPKSRRLRAKLGMIRQLLSTEMMGWNGNRSIDASIFISSLKTIRKAEKECESLGIKKTEFIIFLGLLLDKFSRQKLIVKKPYATKSEFGKMKMVMENEEHPLR